jgi:hypothetical protein
MFQQTYYIASLTEKNPLEIRCRAGGRATLTHISASGEGWLELGLERIENEEDLKAAVATDAAVAAGAAKAGVSPRQPAEPRAEVLFKAVLEERLADFGRADFAGGQFPRILTGDELVLRLVGRAKGVCLALSFEEG